MSSELALLQDVGSSNLPSSTKTQIAAWFDRVRGGKVSGAIAKMGLTKAVRLSGVVDGVRQTGEAIVVGGGLGLLHSEIGLDQKVGNSPSIPIDGALAGVATVLGMVFSGEEWSRDLRTAGACAGSVFTFRKAFELRAKARIKQGQQPVGKFAGDLEDYRDDIGSGYDDQDTNGPDGFGEDPIIAAARRCVDG